MDIMTGESCRQFSLQIWTLSKSQFVHPVGDLGKGADLVILVNSFDYSFIRVHKNLVQHPSNLISIHRTYI